MDSIFNRTTNSIMQNENSASTAVLTVNEEAEVKTFSNTDKPRRGLNYRRTLSLHIPEEETHILRKKIAKFKKSKLMDAASRYVNDLKVRLEQLDKFSTKYPITFKNHQSNIKEKLFEACLHSTINLKPKHYSMQRDLDRFLIKPDELDELQANVRKNQQIPLITLLNVMRAYISCDKSIYELYTENFEGLIVFSVFTDMIVIMSKYYELMPFRRKYSNRQLSGDTRSMLEEHLEWVNL